MCRVFFIWIILPYYSIENNQTKKTKVIAYALE